MLRAYITNLGIYNAGILVGQWIDFPIEEEKLNTVFQEIHVGEEYEEYFFTDFESDFNYQFGQYESIQDLNLLSKNLDNLSEDEFEKFTAVLEAGIDLPEYGIDGLIYLTSHLDQYVLCSSLDDESLGREIASEIESFGTMEKYIDFESYGRDFTINSIGGYSSKGYVYHIF